MMFSRSVCFSKCICIIKSSHISLGIIIFPVFASTKQPFSKFILLAQLLNLLCNALRSLFAPTWKVGSISINSVSGGARHLPFKIYCTNTSYNCSLSIIKLENNSLSFILTKIGVRYFTNLATNHFRTAQENTARCNSRD